MRALPQFPVDQPPVPQSSEHQSPPLRSGAPVSPLTSGADRSATALEFRHAESMEDLRACHPVMLQLRPQLTNFDAFAGTVERQRAQGYRLLMACANDAPLALAGYRCMDNFIHGRFLYVDDLVTASAGRGQGIGEQTLGALRRIAVEQGCAQLVLDTALANSLAQRFYFRWGLLARGLHFSMDLA
jgi:ribosomal protein S18 acetylase RimI-like enzyme